MPASESEFQKVLNLPLGPFKLVKECFDALCFRPSKYFHCFFFCETKFTIVSLSGGRPGYPDGGMPDTVCILNLFRRVI